jgi:hypothetical protein
MRDSAQENWKLKRNSTRVAQGPLTPRHPGLELQGKHFGRLIAPCCPKTRVILIANAAKGSNRGQHDCNASTDQTARLSCVRSFSERDGQMLYEGQVRSNREGRRLLPRIRSG